MTPNLLHFKLAQDCDTSLDVYKVKAAADSNRSTKEPEESFIIQQGVLYRFWRPTKRHLAGRLFKQLVAPSNIYQDLLTEFHNNLFGGHLGRDKTLESLQSRFWWPSMKGDVTKWIESCDECASK